MADKTTRIQGLRTSDGSPVWARQASNTVFKKTTTDDELWSVIVPDRTDINEVIISASSFFEVSYEDGVVGPPSTEGDFVSYTSFNTANLIVAPGCTLYFYTPKAAQIWLEFYCAGV